MNKYQIRRKDLFEIWNARNLNRDELVETFVDTKIYWRLLSSKNHIVLGARGSGKTALVKMIAHDHLSKFKHKIAKQIIKDKSFIGIYLPTPIEWVGSLKNKPWQSEQEAEEFFQFKMNISSCAGFLVTLKSCLDTYIKDVKSRIESERRLCEKISDSWFGNIQKKSIKQLQNELDNIEHERRNKIAEYRVTGKLPKEPFPGIYFQTEIFSQLKRAITLTNEELFFPDYTTWIICIDEAEFLEEMHHRILNSHLRGYSGNICFKITTRPYSHYTLETNTRVLLDVGHDFEYVYIDQDPIDAKSEMMKFPYRIFEKRAKISSKYNNINIDNLLGASIVLDRKELFENHEKYEELLKKYANKPTLARYNKMKDNDSSIKISNQIIRKMAGALLLRDLKDKAKGHSNYPAFSGATMAIRCSDLNPRRLIRLFNSLLIELNPKRMKAKRNKKPLIPVNKQTEVLIQFSHSTLSRIKNEEMGPSLSTFLIGIGKHLQDRLYNQPLSTDQYYSIKVNDDITSEHWAIIKQAVALGLMYPNISISNPDHMPYKEGIFRLSYMLSPYFRLIPRKGKPISLSRILPAIYNKPNTSNYQSELILFEENGD